LSHPTGEPQATGGQGPGSARFLFRAFRRILELNTRALERMAQMDRALGGEYVFDTAFLQSAVRDLGGLAHRVAYYLNGMTGEAEVALYDAYLAVKDALEDILSGGLGPLAGRNALAFSELGWEAEPLAGLPAAALAVLGHQLGLSAADGFALTVTGLSKLREGQAPAAEAGLARELAALEARRGPGPLDLVLCEALPDAPGRILAVQNVDDPAGLLPAVRELLAAHPAPEFPLAAAVLRRTPALLAGSMQTLAFAPALPPAILVQAGHDATDQDRYWIERTAPHALLRSRLAVKPLDALLVQRRPLAVSKGRLLRGSAWLSPERLARLADLGLAAERALGGPHLLRWVLTPDGEAVLTGVEPLTGNLPDPHAAEDVHEPLPGPADKLLAGGRTACGGVGAGAVLPVDDATAPRDVPLGVVGVARAATPGLSRLVPRLAALLTEVGSPASHLGTVARESRVPALFGLPGALSLESGSLVTVDADQAEVYRGMQHGLLHQAAATALETGREPEVQVLRRLLRHIRTLNLHDPESPDFRAERCRTLHDVIHYAHEKAVQSLLDIGSAPTSGLGAPRRLAEESPFAVEILDVGGGLAPGEGPATLEQVASAPLHAFLDGLLLRGLWRQAPARLGLGDIFGGMDRSARMLSSPPRRAGANLAIAAADYVNLTLRLGYHFSVIDALATPRPEHNSIYFRFVGGFADPERRERRAEMLRKALESLGFRAKRQADLVVGRLKLLEREQVLAVLRFLGALTAYTRQLDIDLAGDADVARFMAAFQDEFGPMPQTEGGE
jgi:pyruvate,water dikinase